MSSNAPATGEPALARTMGLWALVIYGVGDMLGSGIYALIGKIAGTMGNAVWLAFATSLCAALMTGLSYASLGSRYPRAAGAAYISHRAFNQTFLSYLTGLAVMASGLTSMATQSRAFAGYFIGLLGVSAADAAALTVAVVLAFIGVLTLINFWGMRESTWLNMVCTLVEIAGLVVVIAVGMRYWGSVNYLETPAAGDDTTGISLLLMLQGGVLAFYAFIGFEDMINVAEEVKNPRRTFPLAVVLALAITTVIYIAVSVSAVSVLSYTDLAASSQPLVDVVKTAAPWFPAWLFSLIALFAIANTGLLNYIMGSRLVYGMARQGFVPAILGRVHPRRRTPHVAIVCLMAIVTVLAFTGNVRELASATSGLLLFVFIIINASLIVLKARPGEPPGEFEIPRWVPVGGIVVCAALLFQADAKALKIAFLLLVGITMLFMVSRPDAIAEDALSQAGGKES